MNTNPNAIKVLCYGDSNTWGQKPDKTGRYATNVRWTGVLQNLLGDSYYIVEEGLGSRTTDLDYDRKPGRNGKSYLVPCIASHAPLDIVTIMLGTNDLKLEYSRSADNIATALKGLVDDVRTYGTDKNGKSPKIILISPILVNDKAPRFTEFYTGYYDSRSMQESLKLAEAIKTVAETNDCLFLNAADIAHPGEDGIHFSEDSNEPLAKLIATTLVNITPIL
jgi:lysophospholipase L1-like esterase